MSENKYGAISVLDLIIYDENGKFVTKLDTLKESTISIDENGNGFLFAKDALFDMDLIDFLYNDNDNSKELSDFEKAIKHMTNKTITFKKNTDSKKCKLIAKSILRNSYTRLDEEVIYEIPNATISKGFEHIANNEEPSPFDLRFDIDESEDDILLQLHRV